MNGPSLFRCPLCGSPLTQEERGCICPARHSFDRAAAGYVHLLPPNRMHSKAPGDDKAMAAARNRFLSGGCSADPVTLLRGAGVDIASPAPVSDALKLFDQLIGEMEELTAE